jgi:hypothetical protein
MTITEQKPTVADLLNKQQTWITIFYRLFFFSIKISFGKPISAAVHNDFFHSNYVLN